MVNEMYFRIIIFCVVWSPVLISLVGRTEAYESVLASISKSKGKSSYQAALLAPSDVVQRETEQAARLVKNGRVQLSDFQTRFPIPRVVERLQVAAGALPGVVLPRTEIIPRRAPAPHTGCVAVNCSSTQFTLWVKKDFYGFTVTPLELTLGRTCKSNGVDESSGDLMFTYPLTSCDSRQEKVPGYILYKYTLYFVPQPTNLPVTWAHGFNVDIECRIQSVHQVRQLAVRPTWAMPARKTLQAQTLGYGIRTMNEDWTTPRPSNVYVLGQKVHLQVFALALPAGGKLYIRQCHASTARSPDAHPKHPVIDNYGCMVPSGQEDGSSGFSQRTDWTIDFVLEAFQFNQNPAAKVFLHCLLFVGTWGPSNSTKSCTFSKQERRWKEISGRDSECDCCRTQCQASDARRAVFEGLRSSGPLLFASVDPGARGSAPPALHRQGGAGRSEKREEEAIQDLEDLEDLEGPEGPEGPEGLEGWEWPEGLEGLEGWEWPGGLEGLEGWEWPGGYESTHGEGRSRGGFGEELGEDKGSAFGMEEEWNALEEGAGPDAEGEELELGGLEFEEGEGPEEGEELEIEGPEFEEGEGPEEGEELEIEGPEFEEGEELETEEWAEPEFEEGAEYVFGQVDPDFEEGEKLETEWERPEVEEPKSKEGEGPEVKGYRKVLMGWPEVGDWDEPGFAGEGLGEEEEDKGNEIRPRAWPGFGEETSEVDWPMQREEGLHREEEPEVTAVMGKGVAKIFSKGTESTSGEEDGARMREGLTFLLRGGPKMKEAVDGGGAVGEGHGEGGPVGRYGPSSGIGDAIFLSGSDWLTSGPSDD